MPNNTSPNKLYPSKWTAVQPQKKEKHFIVTELIRDVVTSFISALLKQFTVGDDKA
jgi:tryptophan-rich hypothetical protein